MKSLLAVDSKRVKDKNMPMEQSLNIIGETFETSIAKDDLLEIVGDLSDYTLEQLINVGENILIISHLFLALKKKAVRSI